MEIEEENIDQIKQQMPDIADLISMSSQTSQEAQSNIDLCDLKDNSKKQAKMIIPGYNILIDHDKKQNKKDVMNAIRRMSSALVFFNVNGND